MSKLKSRKFWVAALSILVGVLGLLGADENLLQFISSAGLILVPAVVYIVTEGKIDAAAVATIDTDALLEAIKGYFTSDTTSTSTGTSTETSTEEDSTDGG